MAVDRRARSGLEIEDAGGDRSWLRRSSLAYHTAFDLCAAEASREAGPVAVLASSPFYARELARRLSGEVLLHFAHAEGLTEPAIRAAMGPEVDWGRMRLVSAWERSKEDCPHMVLWAEPEKQTCEDTLNAVQQLAPSAGRILILGTTRLRRLLPEWQSADSPPARAPLGSMRPIVRALRDLGYAVEGAYGFHGPLSLLWGTASRLPAALGRDDLVDRCFAAMRQAYLVRGWQARWAPVWVVAGRREVD